MIQLIPAGKTRLLLVEGRDDKEFFIQLGRHLGFDDATPIHIIEYGGKDRLAQRLFQLTQLQSFGTVSSLGIVRDTDYETDAFQSVQDAIRTHNKNNRHSPLPIPHSVFESSAENSMISVLLLPAAGREGMLEDLIMEVLRDDSVTACVDKYFECLREFGAAILDHKLSKARLRTFVSGKNASDGATGDDSGKLYLSDTYKMSWWKPEFWEHPTFDEAKAFLTQLLAD